MLRMASHSVPRYLPHASPWSKKPARRWSFSKSTMIFFLYFRAQRISFCTYSRSRHERNGWLSSTSCSGSHTLKRGSVSTVWSTGLALTILVTLGAMLLTLYDVYKYCLLPLHARRTMVREAEARGVAFHEIFIPNKSRKLQLCWREIVSIAIFPCVCVSICQRPPSRFPRTLDRRRCPRQR